MAHYFPCLCLMRILLPFSLTLSVLFRYSGLSLIYLLFLLFLPRLGIPTNTSMTGATGRYLLAVMILSIFTSFVQLCSQILLLFTNTGINNTTEIFLLHVGFVSMKGIRPADGVRYLYPEILMLVTSIIVFIGCKKLTEGITGRRDNQPKSRARYKRFFFFAGNCLVLASFCVSSILCPSILNGIYFLAFLVGMTIWASHRNLYEVGVMLNIIAVIITLHVIALFCVQVHYIQKLLTPYYKYCRYLGLTILVDVKHSDPRELHFVDADWTIFLNPINLLWLNYIVNIQLHLFKGSLERRQPVDTVTSQEQRLAQISSNTSTRQLVRELKRLKGISSTFETKGIEEIQPGIWDHLLDIIYDIAEIIRCSSHIGTNIIMMVWSINYHSWLTFVWLLWACFLWILPNQRLYTFRFSPFLLMYAILLLLCQYVYSMNLTDDELPKEVKGVNLEQIGLLRPSGLPCVPLIIKSLYTLFFWMNVYQSIQERYERKISGLLGVRESLSVKLASSSTRGF